MRGKTLLHLQCHFGMDTLSWARDEGATVTGVDFSEPAVEQARALAAELGIAALVVDAIRREKFFIIPHPEWKEQIRTRMEDILEERNPSVNLAL